MDDGWSSITVLMHRPFSGREGREGRRFEIIVGDHGFLALLEAVLWTDPERVCDELYTHKSVLLRD